MEFYGILMSGDAKLPCFNSQRDGILLGAILYSQRKKQFQFPTGWNSTRSSVERVVVCGVSIPNGMEFYKNRVTSSLALPEVSIPNGMEFYEKSFKNIPIIYLFQFPTGWNST